MRCPPQFHNFRQRLGHSHARSLREVGWQRLSLLQLQPSAETGWDVAAASVQGQHLPRIASAYASNKPPPHTSLPSVLHYVDLYTTHSSGLLQALAAASHAPYDPQLLHWQGQVAYDSQQL